MAHSSTEIIGATSSPSDDQPPHAKKITGAFNIRYPNLPVVEVRSRVQVPLPGTYQVHAAPQTCRDILRVMAIQKKSENEDRENKKRMAEKVVADKNSSKKNRGGGARGGARMFCLQPLTSLTALARKESIDDSSLMPNCAAKLFKIPTRWCSTHAGLVL